ncbi:ankyrin repeat ph and sec7 domain containing protein secg-related [Holotrichia oblita]|nr:ankyrin repeat ph and sec7 domain containing protein secg-related [Holotrichia oblita]
MAQSAMRGVYTQSKFAQEQILIFKSKNLQKNKKERRKMSDEIKKKNNTNEISQIERKARDELIKHKANKKKPISDITDDDLEFNFPSEHSYSDKRQEAFSDGVSSKVPDILLQENKPSPERPSTTAYKVNVKNVVFITLAVILSLLIISTAVIFAVYPQLIWGSNPEQNNSMFNGDTAVIKAIKGNDISKLQNLIDKKSDIHATNKNGDTPLSTAFYLQQFEALKILAENNIDLNTPIIDKTITVSPDGKTETAPAVIIAAKQGNIEMLEHLSALGADINAKQESNGCTALHIAAETGKSEVVTNLVHLGADLESKNKNNQTPAHRAVYNDNTSTGTELLALGASPNATETNLWTPMHHAAQAGKVDFINRLIAAKANANAQTADGWTPLHLAANAGRYECVETLVKNGKANVTMKNNNGETALSFASARGDTKAVDFLIKNGAK